MAICVFLGKTADRKQKEIYAQVNTAEITALTHALRGKLKNVVYNDCPDGQQHMLSSTCTQT